MFSFWCHQCSAGSYPSRVRKSENFPDSMIFVAKTFWIKRQSGGCFSRWAGARRLRQALAPAPRWRRRFSGAGVGNRHRVVKLDLELCLHLAASCGEGKRCSEPSLLSMLKNLHQLTFHFSYWSESEPKKEQSKQEHICSLGRFDLDWKVWPRLILNTQYLIPTKVSCLQCADTSYPIPNTTSLTKIWFLPKALQGYTLNPCTKFPPNPTSTKVNTHESWVWFHLIVKPVLAPKTVAAECAFWFILSPLFLRQTAPALQVVLRITISLYSLVLVSFN